MRFVHSKIDRESKLVMISARVNSKSLMKILPPLIVFNKESIYNEEAQNAFIHAGTYTIKGEFNAK